MYWFPVNFTQVDVAPFKAKPATTADTTIKMEPAAAHTTVITQPATPPS